MPARTLQLARIAWLVAPTSVAFWYVAASLDRGDLNVAVLYTVGPLIVVTALAMVARAVDMLWRRRGLAACLASLDLLTANGWWTITTSAAALALSVSAGWASLSVLGVLGLSVVHVSVLWALVRVSGDDPWRRASLTRRFVPARVFEGEAVNEELHSVDPRIPMGFRLFTTGRVGPRWPTSREVLPAGASEGEVVVARDVGPAIRGVHVPEKIGVWLEDTLGLVHSRHEQVDGGSSRLTVLPRAPRAEGARSVCKKLGHDHEPETVLRLPTEGCQNLREYQTGDDARRIHWMRSLARGREEIIVRLPDELPPEMPSVELVLDTFQVSIADWSSCSEGPHALLDALVRVWLGLGRALAEGGVKVVMVVAGRKVALDPSIVPLRVPLDARSTGPAEELGAQVEWQGALAATDLWTSRSIVVSHRATSGVDDDIARRVFVPPGVWAGEARGGGLDTPARGSLFRLPHPMGAIENRRSHLRAAREGQRSSLDLETLFWATTAQSRLRPPPFAPEKTRFWVATPPGQGPYLTRDEPRPGAHPPLRAHPDGPRADVRSFVARPIGSKRFRIEELR